VRDLAKYVDWRQKPEDPWRVIEERKSRIPRVLPKAASATPLG
jgi:hypothetical protein